MADASAATVHRSAPAEPVVRSRPGPRALQLRILSSLVLAPIAIGAVWFGWPFLPILTAVAAAVMAWEWGRLCRVGRSASRGGRRDADRDFRIAAERPCPGRRGSGGGRGGGGRGDRGWDRAVRGRRGGRFHARRARARRPPDLARIGRAVDRAALRLAAVAGDARRIRAGHAAVDPGNRLGNRYRRLRALAAGSAVRVWRRAGARARPGPGCSAASSAPRSPAGPPRGCSVDPRFYRW